jgi:hypothetical protein
MRLHRPFLKTILLISLSVWLSACGGGGGSGTSPVSNTKVLADNFDSGALATGVWKQSLDGDNRSILDGRLVNKVTSSGPQVSVNTTFIRDYTYIETAVRISSDSVISVGARGKARLAGYFYNDRRGPGSGLPYNGVEGDVWGQVEVNLRDDGTLFAKAFLGPDDADGINSIATFLDQTFSTSVQFDTDYVMSIEQTADDRFILTFNGESFIYQETGPMYPISELSYQGFTARIYAGGTGGTLLVEWDDVYVSKINIGDTGPAGGIVFYVTDGGLHGLEAAPVDQAATAPWGCFGKDIAGADGTTIGTGAQNTADILVDCAELGIAARLADNYSLNGFNDWFLPSQDELNELYLQRAIVGGFTAIDGYWSSSEEFSSSAWVQSFQNGRQYNLEKGDNTFTGTRAVRAF